MPCNKMPETFLKFCISKGIYIIALPGAIEVWRMNPGFLIQEVTPKVHPVEISNRKNIGFISWRQFDRGIDWISFAEELIRLKII